MTVSSVHPCPVCGKSAPSDAAEGGACPYCLLQLGLSSIGPASRTHFSSLGTLAAHSDRFVRQGVLPQFGDYELEAEIARGGMGVVYRARQRSLNRVVAVKMILAGQLATPESVQRFRMEAEAAARLHHPGIVQIYEIGEYETQHFFSMELIDGDSLAECMGEFCLDPKAGTAERRLQERCIAELIVQVARALEFAHQRGVLHRDLKPSNILIDEQGRPHLTDFGLAKLTGRESSGLTLSTAVFGTPGYLAPEQAAGQNDQVTTAADIYGLGATLYELLTGRPPFIGATAIETVRMAMECAPESPRRINPAVHRDLETIALRCLEKPPQRRYHSSADVADDLERFLRREPILARPVGRVERIWRWCQRKPSLAALAGALIIAVLAGTATGLWQWRRAESANVMLTANVLDLQWEAIDDMLAHGQSSRALAKLAALIRENPEDNNAAMLAMSVLEQRRFPLPLAPPIRHPGESELFVARLSPDGTRIATASFDGTARIWDAATSKELTAPLEHQGPVTWAEFSPDGLALATCSQDRTVRTWDVATGKARTPPVVQEEAVERVHFSPDGRLLLTRTRRTVTVLDAQDGRIVLGPLTHQGAVIAAKFRRGGAALFTAQSAGRESRVRAWDIGSGRELGTFVTGSTRDVDLSEALKRVAVLDSGGRGWLADFPGGERRSEISNRNGGLDRIVLCEAGDRVVTVGHDHWARVWNAQTGLPITVELPHFYLLAGAAFLDREGRRLLTWGDDALAQVWDVDTGTPYCEPMRHPYRLVHAEAGTIAQQDVFLTTISHFKSRTQDTHTGAAQLWSVRDRSGASSRSFGFDPGGHDGCKLSPDGRLMAIAPTQQDVRVQDTTTGSLVCGPLRVHGGGWGLLFSPDARRLITTTSAGQVAVWSLPDGKPVAEPVELGTVIQPAEMTEDGRFFATGSTDGLVRLWDAASGKLLREMRHGSEINAVAFSADSSRLASAGEDRIVRIWDTATGIQSQVLTGHGNEVMRVSFSPDGRRVATASLDFTAGLWDTVSGRRLLALPHQGEVLDVAYSPDGRLVATASRDRTAMIWLTDTGLPHTGALLHEQAVRNVRFSPDGRRLLTLDFRGLRLWDVATGHPVTVHLLQTTIGGTGFQRSSGEPQFAPDGRRVLQAGDSYEAKLWYFSEPSGQAPPWFAPFLESVAGQRFTPGTDRPENLPTQHFLDVAARLTASSETDEYTHWARRWLGGSGTGVDRISHK